MFSSKFTYDPFLYKYSIPTQETDYILTVIQRGLCILKPIMVMLTLLASPSAALFLVALSFMALPAQGDKDTVVLLEQRYTGALIRFFLWLESCLTNMYNTPSLQMK